MVNFMFVGLFEHNIDNKGRVIVPAKLRDGLGDVFVMTYGLDGCLYAYTMEGWEKFAAQFDDLPGTRSARMLQSMFFNNAVECEVDKQGRILIPANLRDKVGIQKEVVFAGDRNKVQVWSKESYHAYEAEIADADEVAEKVAEYGIVF